MGNKEEENTGGNKGLKLKAIIIAIASFIALYLILACFFCNHFYIGSKLNGISLSGKTIEAVNEEMVNKVQNYKLKLEERDGKTEEINSDKLNLSFEGKDEIQKLKDKQPGLTWLFNIFSNKETYVDTLISYNDSELNKACDNLACFKKETIVEPKNASFEFSSEGYKVIDEVNGCKVDKVLLKDSVIRSIENMEENFNLENNNCYVVPKYKAGDNKVNSAKDELDKYSKSKINYSAGDSSFVLDGNTIQKLLTVNDEMEVTFDQSKVSEFIKILASKFNTVGINRKFKTTRGSEITVEGGDYGFKINKEKEKEDIIKTIKAGETVDREPIYSQKAISHEGNEIGNTYVEVSIGGQHLWFYKNGELITDGAVVTGNTSAGNGTPAGVYFLLYKETNAILRGDNYATPVNYWMPFNGGIGMHDASWRSSFGGNIYSYSGSHGCVNCPYSLAQKIYNNIDSGTPVICYY